MTRYVQTTAAAIVAAAAALLTLSCESAFLAEPTRWRLVSAMDPSFRVGGLVEPQPGTVTVAGQDTADRRAVILGVRNGQAQEFFRSSYDDSSFDSIAAVGTTIWAAGYKYGQANAAAYVIRSTDGGVSWNEVTLPAEFRAAYAGSIRIAGDGVVWMGVSNGETGDFLVYRGGVWRRVISGLREFKIAVTGGGRAYLYHVAVGSRVLDISDDDGATWTREPVTFDEPGYARDKEVPFSEETLAAFGEGVALSTVVSSANVMSLGAVFTRDAAPPGKGSFDLAFAAPHGPYFWDIRHMAFRSPTDGYVVGRNTSVAIRCGGWEMDAVTVTWNPSFDCLGAGPSGYWAVVSDSEVSRDPLLYWTPPAD